VAADLESIPRGPDRNREYFSQETTVSTNSIVAEEQPTVHGIVGGKPAPEDPPTPQSLQERIYRNASRYLASHDSESAAVRGDLRYSLAEAIVRGHLEAMLADGASAGGAQ
jgi:hypothetical protein